MNLLACTRRWISNRFKMCMYNHLQTLLSGWSDGEFRVNDFECEQEWTTNDNYSQITRRPCFRPANQPITNNTATNSRLLLYQSERKFYFDFDFMFALVYEAKRRNVDFDKPKLNTCIKNINNQSNTAICPIYLLVRGRHSWDQEIRSVFV